MPLRRLLAPVERALFPEINVPDQQDGNVEEHLHVAIHAKGVRYLEHVAVNIRPGIQKNGLNIEQNKDHRYEIELYRKRLARIARGFHTAFIGFLLSPVGTPPADQNGNSG